MNVWSGDDYKVLRDRCSKVGSRERVTESKESPKHCPSIPTIHELPPQTCVGRVDLQATHLFLPREFMFFNECAQILLFHLQNLLSECWLDSHSVCDRLSKSRYAFCVHSLHCKGMHTPLLSELSVHSEKGLACSSTHSTRVHGFQCTRKAMSKYLYAMRVVRHNCMTK